MALAASVALIAIGRWLAARPTLVLLGRPSAQWAGPLLAFGIVGLSMSLVYLVIASKPKRRG